MPNVTVNRITKAPPLGAERPLAPGGGDITLRINPFAWLYVKNKYDSEIVGLKSPLLLWKTDNGVDNSTDDAGISSVKLDIFDPTTKADEAMLQLVNNSGSTKYIRGWCVKGKPVLRLSGENGYIHDEFVDYQAIAVHGEKLLEFGNNYISSKTQLQQIGDYLWKMYHKKKHIYAVVLPGAYYHISPGEWYTLQIGSAGMTEYIDATVELYKINVQRGRHADSRTIFEFREVEQNWTYDSGAEARYLAKGIPKKRYNLNVITVASQTYLKVADRYCDGTADQVEINAAIDDLSAGGGGTLELTEGTFHITGPIVPANNIVIRGRGWNTIIEKNGNFHGINLEGGSGTEYTNILISNLKVTRNASDTNANMHLIYLKYVDKVIIREIWTYNSYAAGCYLESCDDSSILNNYFTDSRGNNLYLACVGGVPTKTKIIGNYFYNSSNGSGLYASYLEHSSINANVIEGNENYGLIFLNCNYNIISSNICKGNGSDPNEAGLTLSASDANTITGNICEGNEEGINILDAACDKNLVSGNYCFNNGADTDIGNANEDNFNDSGTDTNVAGNSWQQPVGGESGRGTMKKHYNLLLDAIDPDVAVTAVDCSAQVPLGARTVLLHIDVSSTGGAHLVNFWDDSGAAAANLWGHAETVGGADDWHGQLIVGLDAARKFYYQASNAAIDDLTVELITYWL